MIQDVQQYRQPEATPVGHSGTRVVIQERSAWAISGWIGVLVIAACIAATILLAEGSPAWVAIFPAVVGALVLSSPIIVQPGHTNVVRFFGSYVGTVRHTGLWWIVRLANRRSLSIRVRNFETNHLKVNDADGNPVEIAAIVVCQVADTSRAVYAVDDSPEIAQAMLRRQQANAVVAARSRIVEGSVGMLEAALARLEQQGIVELDEERKAATVSNLLVVLCADQPVSPVVNTGTLYS